MYMHILKVKYNILMLFQQHGDVASVNVLRDKDTGSPKGFAYVKFHRPYHAAIAMENCKPCKNYFYLILLNILLLKFLRIATVCFPSIHNACFLSYLSSQST
jgi:hypothetical protein